MSIYIQISSSDYSEDRAQSLGLQIAMLAQDEVLLDHGSNSYRVEPPIHADELTREGRQFISER